MYIKLNESEYIALNEAISKAKGYPKDGTNTYASPIPEKYMEITTEVQIEFPELLVNYTLTDTKDEEITDTI